MIFDNGMTLSQYLLWDALQQLKMAWPLLIIGLIVVLVVAVVIETHKGAQA